MNYEERDQQNYTVVQTIHSCEEVLILLSRECFCFKLVV